MARKTKEKPCAHTCSQFTWRPGPGIITRRCSCGELLAIGDANDEPAEVQIEIRAAELATNRELPRKWSESVGWAVHAEAADVAVDPGIAKPAGEWAGWLAREIATHGDRAVRDADAQGLDVTRPIVEQLAVIVLDVQVGEEPEHGVEVTIEVDTIYAPEHDTADARDDRNVGGAQ